MNSQSARSNLQVRIIGDARKLLEKVRAQKDSSLDSSLASIDSHSAEKVPSSGATPKDIVFDMSPRNPTATKRLSMETVEYGSGGESGKCEASDGDSNAAPADMSRLKEGFAKIEETMSKVDAMLREIQDDPLGSGDDDNSFMQDLHGGQVMSMDMENDAMSQCSEISSKSSYVGGAEPNKDGWENDDKMSGSLSRSPSSVSKGGASAPKSVTNSEQDSNDPTSGSGSSAPSSSPSSHIPSSSTESDSDEPTIDTPMSSSHNTDTPHSESHSTKEVKNLEEENMRLQEENKELQLEMETFDEKLACLELTLGIINHVRSSFDEDEENEEVDDDAAELEEEGKKEATSMRKIRPKSGGGADVYDNNQNAQRSLSGEGNATTTVGHNRHNDHGAVEEAEIPYMPLDNDDEAIFGLSIENSAALHGTSKSYSNAMRGNNRNVPVEHVENQDENGASPETTRIKNRSRARRAMKDATNVPESPVIKLQNIDDQLTPTSENEDLSLSVCPNGLSSTVEKPARMQSSLSDIPGLSLTPTSSVDADLSMSTTDSKARKELYLLRERHDNMVYAIKSLAQATIEQTKKRTQYKKRLNKSKKDANETNQKLTKLLLEKHEMRASFLQTRAHYLMEQDKREELSYTVKELAGKLNAMKRERKADEVMKTLILEDITENDLNTTQVNDVVDQSEVTPSLPLTPKSGKRGIPRGSRKGLSPMSPIHLDKSMNCLPSTKKGGGRPSPRSPTKKGVGSPAPRSPTKEGVGSPAPRSPVLKLSVEDTTDVYVSPNKMALELEILNLRSSLKRRDVQIANLEGKLSIAKDYLKGDCNENSNYEKFDWDKCNNLENSSPIAARKERQMNPASSTLAS